MANLFIGKLNCMGIIIENIRNSTLGKTSTFVKPSFVEGNDEYKISFTFYCNLNARHDLHLANLFLSFTKV